MSRTLIPSRAHWQDGNPQLDVTCAQGHVVILVRGTQLIRSTG